MVPAIEHCCGQNAKRIQQSYQLWLCELNQKGWSKQLLVFYLEHFHHIFLWLFIQQLNQSRQSITAHSGLPQLHAPEVVRQAGKTIPYNPQLYTVHFNVSLFLKEKCLLLYISEFFTWKIRGKCANYSTGLF